MDEHVAVITRQPVPAVMDEHWDSVVHISVPAGVNNLVHHLQVAGDGMSGLLVELNQKVLGDNKRQVIQNALNAVKERML